MSEKIAGAMAKAIEYLTANPDEASYTDSPATATLESGLRVKVEGPDGLAVAADMPGAVGGDNSAPSPGWLMRAAIAAGEACLIAMRAAQEGVELEKLVVTMDSESDDRGILGIDRSIPAGPLSARVQVTVSAKDASAEQLRSIVEWAHEHSPPGESVRRAIPMTLELDLG